MYEFLFTENFEPSANTKAWCLYTHKSPRSSAGVTLPGLFQTTYHDWQLMGIVALFAMEGVATYWCYAEGVAIAAILASIFVDVVLALTAHVDQKTICRLQHALVYEPDIAIGALQRQLASTRTQQRFFYSLILFSAGFKVLWFSSAYDILDATTLFIITSYTLGAVLHITCTGYALFTLEFKRRMHSEHNRYLDSQRRRHAFDETAPLRAKLSANDLQEGEVGRHRITRGDEGAMYLETFGVLTDGELWALIGKQIESGRKRALAVDGAQHQMRILQQDPMGPTNTRKRPAPREGDALAIVAGRKAG